MSRREQHTWSLWWKAQHAITAELDAKLDLLRKRGGDPEVEAFYTERLMRFTEAKERAVKAYRDYWPEGTAA